MRRSLRISLVPLVAALLGGCASGPPAPAPSATKVTPATADAAQSHRTTPAAREVTTTRTIEIVLPEPPAPPAPPAPPQAPEASQAAPLGPEAPRGHHASVPPLGRAAGLVARTAPLWAALAANLAGDLVVDGQTIGGLPPGATVRVTDSKTTVDTGAAVDARATAKSSGPGLDTNSPNGAAGLDASAPNVALPGFPGVAGPGAGASGGSTEATATWKAPSIPGTKINVFQVAGAILLIGAAVVWFAGKRLGVGAGVVPGILAVGGASSLALGFLLAAPWWVQVAMVVIPLGGGVALYLVHRAKDAAKIKQGELDKKVATASVVAIETKGTTETKEAVTLARAGWGEEVGARIKEILRSEDFGVR